MLIKNFIPSFKSIWQLLGLFLLLLLGLGLYQKFKPQSPDYLVNTNQVTVIKQIQALGRLETVVFTLEKIIDAKTNTDNVFKEFLFADKILLIAHGQAIAGVNLANLKADDIKIETDFLTLKLPAPEVFTVSLDQSKTQVYDRSYGLLSKGDKDLESVARQAAETAILKAACEADILNTANDNAVKQLETLFTALGFKTVTIQVQAGKCYE